MCSVWVWCVVVCVVAVVVVMVLSATTSVTSSSAIVESVNRHQTAAEDV